VTARPQAAPARNITGVPTIPPDSPLLLLGSRSDAASERGVICPGDLPAPNDPTLEARARAARDALGDQVLILGHHYQRDQVIAYADARGDSFELSQRAATSDAPYIVFCGVHFMAESASILAREDQTVILPDLAAGCSMADMAEIGQLRDAWDRLARAGITDRTVPLTYMNSTAAIKAFCGEHHGAICTSSNAARAMSWAFDEALPDVSTSQKRRCCFCLTSTWVATRQCSGWGCRSTTVWSTTHGRLTVGCPTRSCTRRASSCGRAIVLCTRDSNLRWSMRFARN
jgi:quinolinate synthase